MSEKTTVGRCSPDSRAERLPGAVGDDGLEAELAQHPRRQLGDQAVVLDDEHPAARARASALLSAAIAPRVAGRKRVKVAPSPGRDSTVDRAAHLLGEAEHLAEAEPGAFADSSWS